MLFETAQEYFKLERMELASLKKKTLCSKIYDIYEKLVKIYNEFAELNYDILMPEEIRFNDHVISFLAKVNAIISCTLCMTIILFTLHKITRYPLPSQCKKKLLTLLP